MVNVLQKHHARAHAMRKSYPRMGMGKCEPGRHVVSCWPKREGIYVGVGICGSAGWWREVTVGWQLGARVEVSGSN